MARSQLFNQCQWMRRALASRGVQANRDMNRESLPVPFQIEKRHVKTSLRPGSLTQIGKKQPYMPSWINQEHLTGLYMSPTSLICRIAWSALGPTSVTSWLLYRDRFWKWAGPEHSFHARVVNVGWVGFDELWPSPTQPNPCLRHAFFLQRCWWIWPARPDLGKCHFGQIWALI